MTRRIMLKRHLIFAFATFYTFQPLQAQEWFDRYMRERKAQEGTQQPENRGRQQPREERRQRAVPRATPASAPTTLRDVIETRQEQEREAGTVSETETATPTATATTATTPAPSSEPTPSVPITREVRRAIPLEPFNPPASEETPSDPKKREDAQPAATPRIPRALPVERGESDRTETPEMRTSEGEAPKVKIEADAEDDESEDEEDGAAAAESTESTEAAAKKRKEEAERDQATLDALDPSARTIRLSPGATSTPPDVEQMMLANSFYNRKEYDRAAPEYEHYLKLYPRGAERQAALFRLAESYRQQGSFNAARQYYEALIYNFQVGDYIGPAAYRLAELYYQEKDYTAAVSLFRKASVWVKEPSIALSAKFYAARALQTGGRSSEAIRGFEDVLTFEEALVNPFREAAKLALVELYSETGRSSSALKLLLELRAETQKEGVRAEASVRLGMLYLERKEPEKAQKELVAALLTMPDDDPWRAPAEVGLLRLYYASGKYKEALAVYEKSSKKFEPSVAPEVLLLVANSHRQLKQGEQASALYQRVIEENPESPYAAEARYQQLTVLYNSNSRDLLPAIDAYLEQYPDKGAKRDQLVLMKAELFYKTGQFAQAAYLYTELKDSELPDLLKSEALFKLGWCETQIGGYQNAIAAFTDFLKKYPRHKLAATAVAQRAVCHEKLKDYRAAVGDLDLLISQYPKAREREFALQRKGLILGQQDDNGGMVEAFRELLREFPKSTAAGQANYWIGQAAFQAKDYRNAVKPLQTARDLDPEFADRASVSLLAALFYLEERETLREEVDRVFQAKESKVRVQPQILRWLGGAYLKDSNPMGAEKAETYLTRLTTQEEAEVEPDDWLWLGEAKVKQRKWAEAEETLKVYLTKVSDPLPQARGYLLLGEAQIGAGQTDAAYATAAKVQQLQPEGRLNAQGRMLAGSVLAAQEKWDEAAKTYMGIALIFEDPTITPRALEQAYLAYLKLENEAEAKKTLNRLQSRFPEYDLGPEAAQR